MGSVLLPKSSSSDFFDTDQVTWVSSNLLYPPAERGANWLCIFGVTAWKLWKWRNEFIFQGTRRTGIEGVQEISTYVEGLERLVANDRKLGGLGQLRMERWIRWEKPPEGWVKVNSDGSFSPQTGLGTAGGLIRDEHGSWKGGFTVKLGACSIMAAELWGLYRGLALAWDLGFRQVEAEVDNKSVVKFTRCSEIDPGPTTWLPSQRMERWDIKSYMIRRMGFVSGSIMTFLA
ncbi:Polynucleotidyl transferase- ribonuclease H-like superfamily protein [Striga hermonthica]|uniref:Polynucleotidyl transferase- ribonuclease H-like superfamily protein n=1 Tax=Striga hermonthica TaxID=68872 RepID=A0A9N7MRL7_STRHE|nr:Polynucleotidyl transferase- ribonuclease H-like superfamily protein [Striga hermonthica]